MSLIVHTLTLAVITSQFVFFFLTLLATYKYEDHYSRLHGDNLELIHFK